ncbi:MAG: TylF/MycF/NovP-related O-methyltransferase, partial [Terriglobia bacterium]
EETARSMTAKSMLKALANEIGARLPDSILNRTASTLNYLYTGRWMRKRKLSPAVRVETRFDLIRNLAAPIAEQEVLYLEFGVWRGETIKLWSQLLRNPASRLHGFDSFEGLPESWDNREASGQSLAKGSFSTDGVMPEIPDPRVVFFKGWFQETLPQYDFIPSPVIVISIDADLYSSAIYVLKTLLPHISIGTIIYLDEFWDPQHEQRAFSEFLAESGMRFEAVVADYGTKHVAFRRIE